MDINDILKPKNEDEIYNSALEIADPNELLKAAIYKIKKPNLIKLALERGADPNIADRSGNIDSPKVIEALLENIDSKLNINSIVLKGIKFGFEDLLINLIDKKLLNPSSKNYIMLVWAIGFRYPMKKLIKKLLNDKRIDPRKEKESIAEAISIAIARNKNNILKILLNDERIDPSADNNRAIKTAVMYKNIEAIKMLLNDERVDPVEALEIAVEKNYTKVIKTILDNSDIDN